MAGARAVLLTVPLFAGCSQTVKRIGYAKPAAEPPVCVVDFARPGDVPMRDSLPRLGTVRVRDALFTLECTESDALELIRSEACGLGANLAVIDNRKTPDLWLSSCFRAKADLLRAPDSLRVPLRTGFYAPDSVAARTRAQEKTQWTGIVAGLATGFAVGAVLIFSSK